MYGTASMLLKVGFKPTSFDPDFERFCSTGSQSISYFLL